MRTLTVRPFTPGWSVSLEGVEDMLFLSGAEAESAARHLATRLVAAGEAVKLVVMLRDGSVGGRFVFPPDGLNRVTGIRDAA